MRFSVIVPVYNIELYIEKCILSIINQTYDDIEIIIVDDGSTDTSRTICDCYAAQDPRIIVIHKENGGLVSARKAGSAIATGDYTLYVDGDDWLDKNTIAEIYKYIDKYSPDCVCFGFIVRKKDSDIEMMVNANCGLYSKADLERKIYPYLIEDKQGKYFLHSAWGKAYKTNILKTFQMSVDDNISMSEDAALTIPLISNINTMFVMPDCLYNYNMLNELSITRAKKVLNWDNQYYLMNHFRDNLVLLNRDFEEQIYRNALHNLFNVAIAQFNSRLSYAENIRIISEELSKERYSEALKYGKHSLFTINAVADFILKHKLYWALYLCWKLKYR